jgi:hypothetical protein
LRSVFIAPYSLISGATCSPGLVWERLAVAA